MHCVKWLLYVIVAFAFLLIFLVVQWMLLFGCEGFIHPWEGREVLGEGVSWAQQCGWETLPLGGRDFMDYGLHWSHLPFVVLWNVSHMHFLLCYGRHKWSDVRGVCFLIALLRHIAIAKLYDFKDMAFSSLKSLPSPNVHVSNGESLCKNLVGSVNVLCWCSCMHKWVCLGVIPFEPCFPQLGGWPP